jgi:hypothetical protein
MHQTAVKNYVHRPLHQQTLVLLDTASLLMLARFPSQTESLSRLFLLYQFVNLVTKPKVVLHKYVVVTGLSPPSMVICTPSLCCIMAVNAGSGPSSSSHFGTYGDVTSRLSTDKGIDNRARQLSTPEAR